LKTVLGIVGSMRRLGNCEIMVKEIGRRIAEPHRLKLLRLPEFDIAPCRGCYTCLVKDQCVIDDDYPRVAEALLEADMLIVAAPTYFLGPSAILKRFTDRGLSLYPHVENLWAKPAVAVGIAGIAGKEGYTLLGLENFIKMIFGDLRMGRIVYGALPGEVFLNEENLHTAAELAAVLMDDTAGTVEPCCPLCGGQTVRFLGNNQVRCMLCSNAGTLSMEGKVPRLNMQRSRHEFFLTREDALAHKQWLVGMKSRFLEHKKPLKQISLEYREDGQWVRPPKSDDQ
jgi:multimeric flavodoxin WrbA